MQGPAELLPISSSGHVLLAPALLGWPYGRLDPSLRKAFEVALHAGTAAGLALTLRGELAPALRSLDRRRALELALSTAPPAAAGLLLRAPVEERLSAPRPVAAAQVIAGGLLWLADRRPGDRRREQAGLSDALALGIGQAAALAPGVSRGGAALSALRWRRLARRDAAVLARHAAAPLLLGATALELVRIAREGMPRTAAAPMGAGVAAAFASTVASSRLVPAIDGVRSYAPFAVYRMAFGAAVMIRLRRADGCA